MLEELDTFIETGTDGLADLTDILVDGGNWGDTPQSPGATSLLVGVTAGAALTAPIIARRRWKMGARDVVIESAHDDRVDNLGHRVRAISTYMDGERRNVQHQAAMRAGVTLLTGWKTQHGAAASSTASSTAPAVPPHGHHHHHGPVGSAGAVLAGGRALSAGSTSARVDGPSAYILCVHLVS